MTQPVLDVRDLRIEFVTRYGPVVAVDDVSLTIGRGEILGVVGESGAGKSLTGNAVIGLLQPLAGLLPAASIWAASGSTICPRPASAASAAGAWVPSSRIR